METQQANQRETKLGEHGKLEASSSAHKFHADSLNFPLKKKKKGLMFLTTQT